LYLARDLKYYDDSTVRMVEYSAATEVLRAYRNGAIDGAALTLDEVLLLAQDGEEPRIVAVLDYSNGADVVLARPPIRDLAGLRGHRIAVENTALGAYMLERALDEAKLQPSDVTIVPTTEDEHESAYLSKRVDAVVTFEPVRSRLLKAGAVNVFDSSRIPGEIIDVLVVRRAYAENHPEQVQRLVEGWYRAVLYTDKAVADAAQRMAKRERISPHEFLRSLTGIRLSHLADNRVLLDGTKPGIIIPAERLAQTMWEKRLLRRSEADIAVLPYPQPLRHLVHLEEQGP
jgi:NitT/TauT family transport system substrate-binding protein